MSLLTNNYQKLVEICEHDNALVTQVINTIQETFPNHISEVDNAITKQDNESLKALLHLLKGSLSYLAIEQEAELFSQLETFVETNQQEAFAKAYPPLREFILSLPQQLQDIHNT